MREEGNENILNQFKMAAICLTVQTISLLSVFVSNHDEQKENNVFLNTLENHENQIVDESKDD
jgi:hypothetical protein